jgi:hypothetical protein
MSLICDIEGNYKKDKLTFFFFRGRGSPEISLLRATKLQICSCFELMLLPTQLACSKPSKKYSLVVILQTETFKWPWMSQNKLRF